MLHQRQLLSVKISIGVLLAVLAGLSGCSIVNPHGTMGEKGQVWCNERYRDRVFWDEATKKASLTGYMYGLAAALVLQSDDPSDKEAQAHYFRQPDRLEVLDRPPRSESGFEVTTFRLRPLVDEKQEEIVIAFAGSNDRSDWLSTNLNPFGREQYDEAVAYTKKILANPNVQGKKLVLTGISLGGGLVVHVIKNAELEPFIDQAWALNPSPKIFSPKPASDRMKSKTWLGYTEGEVLSQFRSDGLRQLIPGAGDIEVANGQKAVFKLIEANQIYAHFRWGIARQMLWIADFELTRKKKNAWTEPFAILQDSAFRSCLGERPKYKIDPELQPTGPRPDYSGSKSASQRAPFANAN